MTKYGPENPDATYVTHEYPEAGFDTGEVTLNYATTGSSDKPALLLIPAQSNSWWSYEPVMKLLADDFEVFAVDLRGQGRSTRTPGRYTLDNMGNDLVRFISGRIRRPVIVSGASSGGLVTAWLSAYASPGLIRAAYYEDAPLFAAETRPAYGQGISQGIGPMHRLMSTYLGDQWSIGDYRGLVRAMPTSLPPAMLAGLAAMSGHNDSADPDGPGADNYFAGDEPPQALKEYDPEWACSFWTGTVGASCDHAQMLAAVKVPVMFAHHFHAIDEASGRLLGAISDFQVHHVSELITQAGQRFYYKSFSEMGHIMHEIDPDLYVKVLTGWISTLDA